MTTKNRVYIDVTYDNKKWNLVCNDETIGSYDRIEFKGGILPAIKWCLTEYFSQFTDLDRHGQKRDKPSRFGRRKDDTPKKSRKPEKVEENTETRVETLENSIQD